MASLTIYYHLLIWSIQLKFSIFRQTLLTIGPILALSTVPAFAQQSDADRPINVVSPFSAGTGSDITARAFSQSLGQVLKRNVIVTNRDGASGVIGVQFLLQSPADGYTLVMGPMTPVAIQPHLVKGLTITPASVDPVCNVAENILSIVVRADSPAKNLQDLVALAKAGSVNFGTPGQNSAPHMGIERIRMAVGGNWVHIPFRGDPPVLQELLGGRLDFAATAVISASTHIKAGTMRMIAVQSSRRHPEFPNVPTIREQGIDVAQISYTSLYAPANTPSAVLQRLETACKETTESASFRSAAASAGILIEYKNGKDFRKILNDEYEISGRVIRALGIKPI